MPVPSVKKMTPIVIIVERDVLFKTVAALLLLFFSTTVAFIAMLFYPIVSAYATLVFGSIAFVMLAVAVLLMLANIAQTEWYPIHHDGNVGLRGDTPFNDPERMG